MESAHRPDVDAKKHGLNREITGLLASFRQRSFQVFGILRYLINRKIKNKNAHSMDATLPFGEPFVWRGWPFDDLKSSWRSGPLGASCFVF